MFWRDGTFNVPGEPTSTITLFSFFYSQLLQLSKLISFQHQKQIIKQLLFKNLLSADIINILQNV